MKHLIGPVLLTVALLVSGNTFAATIHYQTRLINAGVDKTNYRKSWHDQSSAVTKHVYSNFDSVWGGNNTFSRLSINFSGGYSSILFQIAPDAGYGGALYLDGLKMTEKQHDLWWGYDWNKSGQLLSASLINIASGNHILEVFWAENCCNGASSGRFSLDNGSTWQNLSNANLTRLAPVPLPSALWLLASGLLILHVVERKKLPSNRRLLAQHG